MPAMKKIKRFAAPAIGMILLLCGSAAAQPRASADSLFNAAVRSYKKGQYQASLSGLEALDRSRPNHPLTTASLFMQAKSLYKLGETQRAREAFQELIRDYPQSRYADDARYGLAQVMYRQNAVRESVLQLMELLARGGNKILLEKSEKLASDMMDAFMEVPDLKNLMRDIPDEKGKAFTALKIARREIQDRRFQSAYEVLDDFLGAHPDNAYSPQMTKLRSRAESLGKGVARLGVILPLTGPLGEQGGQILAGVQYAVRLNNERRQLKFDLITRDSEGAMIKAVKAAQEICHDPDVAAVIGDLESLVTIGVAAVAQENETPCIAPVAMEDGLADIGPCVFQLNGFLGERARALADYAITSLGLKRFALLYPSDAYGRVMRKAFSEAVAQKGGEIIAERWYAEGTADFSPQMNAIREAGLRRMIIDSLAAVRGGGSNSELQKPFVDRIIEDRLDKREFPVTSIDGFLVLTSRPSAESVLSQVTYNNIQSQLLGGSAWDDLAVLTGHRDALEGIVYVSDYFADPYSPPVSAFRAGFRKAMGRNPDKMEAIGFDAASVLFEAMGDKAMVRASVRDALAAVRGFEGVRGTVSFDKNRVNSAFRLLQFRDGKVGIVR
jgi:ABC-type branched-subunit amino acid transport system substrate-binding protein